MRIWYVHTLQYTSWLSLIVVVVPVCCTAITPLPPAGGHGNDEESVAESLCSRTATASVLISNMHLPIVLRAPCFGISYGIDYPLTVNCGMLHRHLRTGLLGLGTVVDRQKFEVQDFKKLQLLSNVRECQWRRAAVCTSCRSRPTGIQYRIYPKIRVNPSCQSYGIQ
ncbi:hypothetical protein EDB89DRAFT_1090158 [Lactarius sanguifluus]|nr:hypothetical protein EDB89DRAFT_1090158 [Lactarius sanguifluus]